MLTKSLSVLSISLVSLFWSKHNHFEVQKRKEGVVN
jgi:hypothetical protein